jgi:hypothetical protein
VAWPDCIQVRLLCCCGVVFQHALLGMGALVCCCVSALHVCTGVRGQTCLWFTRLHSGACW